MSTASGETNLKGALEPAMATQPRGNKRASLDTYTSPPSKKLKGGDLTPKDKVEENKENHSRVSIPTPKPKVDKDNKPTECPTTPGRVGPIMPSRYDLNPTIAPFKGPKGSKVRKSAYEKEQEYV